MKFSYRFHWNFEPRQKPKMFIEFILKFRFSFQLKYSLASIQLGLFPTNSILSRSSRPMISISLSSTIV